MAKKMATRFRRLLLSWWQHYVSNNANVTAVPTVAVNSPWTQIESPPATNAPRLSHSRTYVFNTPFGSQFFMKSQAILSAPATLKLEASSGGGLQTVDVVPTWLFNTGGQARWSWSWTGTNGIGARGTITVEADGAIRQQFTLVRTTSQKFNKISLTFPITPSLCQYLMKYPRIGYGHATEDLTSGTWERVWGDTYEGSVHYSNEFPRVLKIHNGDYGLEWAMETDEFWAGNAGASDSSITLNTTTGEFVLNICNGAWPTVSDTYDMSFDFWFTPLPTKPQNENIIRVGDCGDTPAVTEFRPMAEECAGSSPWKYQGSLVAREGSFTYSSTGVATSDTFANHRANLLARGLKTAGYTSWGIWPSADPSYVSGWYRTEGFLTATLPYTINCNTVDTYTLPGVDCAQESFKAMALARWESAVFGSEQVVDHLYFDVTNLSRDTDGVIDQTGVRRYRYLIYAPREISRACQTICQSRGAKVISHPQSDWVACIHSFFDIHVPGEQHTHDITEETDGFVRRRFYLGSVPQKNWRTECSTKLIGMPSMFLPEVIDTGSNEDFATEVCIAASALHNLGYWKSFGTTPPALRYFTAVRNFGMTDATFYGYWDAAAPALTDDADAYLACWTKGSSLLVAVVNMLDSDRDITITTVGTSTSPLIRYSGYGRSVIESRTTNYEGAVASTDTNEYAVGVGRYNMTMVEFNYSAPIDPPVGAAGVPTTSFGRPSGRPEVYQRRG
jgi:hypothetical protein